MGLSYNDIGEGISKILKAAFPTYKMFFEPVTSGMQRPSFFINTIPVSCLNQNIYFREQRALIDINYFSDELPDLQSNKKNNAMANSLENILNCDLKILDRNLNLSEIEFNTQDRVLHATFTLMWYNENEVTEAYLAGFQIMQKVYIDGDLVVMTENGVYKSQGKFYIQCTDADVAAYKAAGQLN
jgi:hypothetical protein